MKVRLGFVTNSSSSCFILHLNKISKVQKLALIKMVRNPVPYKEQFIKWMDSNFPVYRKSNPNNIPSFYILKDDLGNPSEIKENIEYNNLPDELWSFSNVCFMEDCTEWDIRKVDANTYSFMCSMDNFDYTEFLQFAMEQVTGRHFNGEKEKNEFLDEFLTDMDCNVYQIYNDKNNERWKKQRVRISNK